MYRGGGEEKSYKVLRYRSAGDEAYPALFITK